MSKHNYTLGTQEMLDAAKDDATKIPFETVFIRDGYEVIRNSWHYDDEESVFFSKIDNMNYLSATSHYYSANELLPAKKKKQKKEKHTHWQNGTQADLDKSNGNALKIPKKTYFMSKITKRVVYRVDNHLNDKDSILMLSDSNLDPCFHSLEDLTPITYNEQ